MSDYERNVPTNSLLKYFELGAMNMVIIYEAWKYYVGEFNSFS